MHRRRFDTLVIALAVTLLPAGAAAQVVGSSESSDASEASVQEDADETDTESDGSSKNWRVAGSVTSRVGQGTFVSVGNETGVSAPTAPNSTAFDRAALIYALKPSYEVGDFRFTGQISLTHWLTQGGGLNEPGEIRFQDSALKTRWSGYTFEAIGARLGGQVNLGLPTSAMSQTASRLLTATTTATLSKRLFGGDVTVTLIGGGSKLFHKYKSPRVDLDQVGEENALFRQGESEDLGSDLVAIGGLNPSWALTGGLNTRFSLVKNLSASVSYSLSKYWTYRIDNDDEFQSQYARTGRGQQDVSTASLSLAYKINDYLDVSGGLRTKQQPKTADNESFRFPFWNTQGAAANRSVLQLTVNGKY